MDRTEPSLGDVNEAVIGGYPRIISKQPITPGTGRRDVDHMLAKVGTAQNQGREMVGDDIRALLSTDRKPSSTAGVRPGAGERDDGDDEVLIIEADSAAMMQRAVGCGSAGRSQRWPTF